MSTLINVGEKEEVRVDRGRKNVSLRIEENYAKLSEAAARSIASQLIRNPTTTLGLATGETPKGTYEELTKLFHEGLVDFKGITTFNLDEYYPISPEDEASFNLYMKKHFFDRVNVKEERTHIPNGSVAREEVEEECGSYERKIRENGGIDMQLLGIGENGHIGFNEPGTAWGKGVRLVELSEETVEVNFGGRAEEGKGDKDLNRDLPREALTMGIRNIMNADRLLLLASGERKAAVLERALRGPVTKEVPASILQLHPRLKVICDREAADRFVL